MQFRGREDEFDMLRRLFQGLEQSVKSLGREHMDFVDDVNFKTALRGLEFHIFPQVPYLINPAVGSTVHFEHIQAGALRDFLAGNAFAARLGLYPLFAIQRLGQDARG